MRFLCSRKRVGVNLDKVESILVLRYDRIGDMVVTTPLFKALRDRFPEAKISVLASQSNAKIIENNPNINQVYVFPSSLIKRLLILTKLRAEQFSLLVDLEHNLIWHIIFHIRFINPKWVASSFKFDRYGVNPNSLGLFTIIAKTRASVAMAEIYMGIAQALGVLRTDGDLRYQLMCSIKNIAYASAVLGDKKSFVVGINLFGSKNGWEIRKEDCARICKDILTLRPQTKILLFSTPSSFGEISQLVESINLSSISLLKPTDDVMDAAAVISKLDLLVTPDTSLTHIACAFDTPLVTVNPKSDAVFANWKPLHPSGRVKVIFSKYEKSLKGYSYAELKRAVENFL
jgi:ADP-heptose:LPS heptosyltransferase